MNHAFSSATERQRVLVEYLTPAGSAFAVTTSGDSVFVNARIVESIGVKANQEYDAFLLANYPDKREFTPWRAMRLQPVRAEAEPVETTAADVLSFLDHDPRAVTVGILAKSMDIEADVASKLLSKLHASGKLAKIGLYSSTSSERASQVAYCRQQDSAPVFDWMLDWAEDDEVES